VSRLNLSLALRQYLPFLSRPDRALPRGRMLALRPRRSAQIAWEPLAGDEAGARLTVPRRDDGVRRLLARWLNVPTTRTIELDEINAQIWERCDGQHSVEQLVSYTCLTYKMNRRQGEVGVVTAMRMLAQRGLIELPPPTSGAAGEERAADVHPRDGGAGNNRHGPSPKRRRRRH